MKKCVICGVEFSDEAQFCPKCGSRLASSGIDNSLSNMTKTQNKKNKRGIIIGIVAALTIIIIAICVLMPKELVINNGENIVAYVGESKEISLYGNGLSQSDYDNAEWYLYDDTAKITIKNNKIRATYDADALVNHSTEGASTDYYPADGEFSYRTTVKATIKKGIRRWKGDATIVVKLKEKKITNGKIVKAPSDSRTVSFEVTAADDVNAYIYLMSKNDSSNDMSFLVKKGKTATVYVPKDYYYVYVAQGDNWYGKKYLFGPGTAMTKDKEVLDFVQYYWTYQLQAADGNVESENINSEDFPR